MKLNNLIEKLHNLEAKQRLQICEKCNFLDLANYKCLECGCFMRLKVMMPTARCPKSKW